MAERIRITHGNVFKHLGFSAEEAENLRIRSDLMIRLGELIKDRGLTQVEAAKLFDVSQPRVSDLVRGKIDRFSIDTLVAMLGHAGVKVSLILRDNRRANAHRLAPGGSAIPVRRSVPRPRKELAKLR